MSNPRTQAGKRQQASRGEVVSDSPKDVAMAEKERVRLAKKFPDMGIIPRHEALQEVSRLVGISRSRSAFAENYGKPGGVIEVKQGVDYSAEGAQVNANQAKREASEFLQIACGDCALAGICNIKGNLNAWVQHHPYSVNPRDEDKIITTEDRTHALRRLENPMEPCVSSQIENELAERARQKQTPNMPHAA